MWTLSVSFLLNVESHWSHLNVLSPAARIEKHLWEPFPVIYCWASEHTVITHSKSRTNFAGAIVRAEKYKEGCFIAPDNPEQWSLERSGSVFLLLCICSWHPRGGKKVLCHMFHLNVKKPWLILLNHSTEKHYNSRQAVLRRYIVAQSQLFTECSLMFSFTPPYNSLYCWRVVVSIIWRSFNSHRVVCVCVRECTRKCLQACAHSPITKADDGQLNKMEHQRKPTSIVFLIRSEHALDDD